MVAPLVAEAGTAARLPLVAEAGTGTPYEQLVETLDPLEQQAETAATPAVPAPPVATAPDTPAMAVVAMAILAASEVGLAPPAVAVGCASLELLSAACARAAEGLQPSPLLALGSLAPPPLRSTFPLCLLLLLTSVCVPSSCHMGKVPGEMCHGSPQLKHHSSPNRQVRQTCCGFCCCSGCCLLILLSPLILLHKIEN
ncbi:UNVERIFIED_CONTAM: hypothetical protein FKN15_057425 [Acipenser sinensis]